MERDNNTAYPTQGRRSVSKATKLRRRKQRMNFVLLLCAIAAIALLTVVLPLAINGEVSLEPRKRANYSFATESGLTDKPTEDNFSNYLGLVISEIMPSNASAVTDENGNYPDWVEIWNHSNHSMELAGIGLSDRGDRVLFLFPDITLEADERIVVFCDKTNQAVANKPLHAKFALSSAGETVYLYDTNAYLLDSCKYPIMASNESYALVGEKDNKREYQVVTWISPGYPNTEEGHQAYRESVSAVEGQVLINEVMADAVTGIRDDHDNTCDWIELYNTTDHDIKLNRYALSDNEGNPLKWRFPDDAVIPANGYYLVLCTGEDRPDTVMQGVYHTNFRISAEKETLILADSQGQVVDRVMIDNLPKDCSWGRNEWNQFEVFQTPTPSLPNNQTGFNQMELKLRAMNKTGVWISEVMASNDAIATYKDAGNTDWVEIYNSSGTAVDISEWGLSDNLNRGRKWQFPKGTVINAGEYKVVLCDKNLSKNTAAEPHASFKISKNAGEIITLTDKDGQILDKVILPEMKTDVSYGRTLGIAGLFYYDTPTPFQSNGTGFTGFAEMPSFTVEPGQYTTAQFVSINVPEGTQVYYTTDGSTPTQDSIPYNGERLKVQNTATVLRARAFGTGMIKPSDVLTGTYFVNAYNTLPVVSIVTDPKNLWDSQYGLLTVGDNVVKEAGKLPFKNTIYRAVKKAGIKYECNVEMYDSSGNIILNQGAEFGTMGDYSLDMPQKSFKFKAKSKYGAKTFEAALFPDRPYTEYKGFVLRNSGNDCMWTRMVDGFESRLMDSIGINVAHQAWKPYAVYLNGVYWGHMNLRERTDRYLVAQFEGLTLEEADQMDLLQGSGSVKYGSNKAYKAMIKKIKAGNPAKNPEDLQYILDNVDVDNLFEYLAIEMFFGNSDIGNTRFYRLKTEGSKWRWVLYDLDYGLFNSGFDSPKSYTKAKGMGDQKIDNTIFLKLLSVPEYKDKFLRIFGNVYKQFTTRYMLTMLEEVLSEIEPEMSLHWARWGTENDKFVIEEVPTTTDGAYRYWEKRVERLRNVCRKRPNRLWTFAQNAFNLTDAQMIEYFGPQPEMPADAI
ncbi:MAG: lamin tail domain-containing protein [Clostridia bacterium]|nr:lamin tail domain-containing protein [Clostridia bacterium]